MKTLEIKPIKGKALKLLLVEKEYDEYWSIITELSKPPFRILHKPSIVFCEFLEKLIMKYNPDFATEELGMRSQKDFYEKNILSKLFHNHNIPLYSVELDMYARGYLEASLSEKGDFRDKILNELDRLSMMEENDKVRKKIEYLTAYGQYLQQEFEEEERKIGFDIRESWIVKGIIDHADENKKKRVISIHICSPKHMNGITQLLRSLDVEVLPISLEKKISTEVNPSELTKLLESLEIKAIPVIKKDVKTPWQPYILFFLDTDKYASPFDICMAYDAGFEAVVPYQDITVNDTRLLTQDVIFSRGPEGIKRTCFLIGGRDHQKAKQIVEIIKSSMFPPFEVSVIIDPKGAYTTAAAMVAKIEWGAKQIGLSLKDKKVVILAGTGPVGRAAADLCARLGCRPYITSRVKKRAESVAKEILEEKKVMVRGFKAASTSETYDLVRDADIILATGAVGVNLVPEEIAEKLKGKKILADVNAVPPPGIAMVKPKYDLKEVSSSIYGIGALAIGDLKYRLERKILMDARKTGKGIFDYDYFFKEAKKLLELEKEILPTITVSKFEGK